MPPEESVVAKVIKVNGVEITLTPVKVSKRSKERAGEIYYAPVEENPEVLERAFGRTKLFEDILIPKIKQFCQNYHREAQSEATDDSGALNMQTYWEKFVEFFSVLSTRGQTVKELKEHLHPSN